MLLNNLGEVARYRSDYERAAILYEHSLALRRELRDSRGVAVCLLNLGLMALQRDDAARAEGLLRDSLALQRKVGDRFNLAYALEGLAISNAVHLEMTTDWRMDNMREIGAEHASHGSARHRIGTPGARARLWRP